MINHLNLQKTLNNTNNTNNINTNNINNLPSSSLPSSLKSPSFIPCKGAPIPPDAVCCPGTWGGFTTTDMINAVGFAMAQINKIKSQDKSLIQKYCKDGSTGTNCFVWKNHKTNQTWLDPNFKPSSLKSTTLTPYPWESWDDWTSAGHVHIVNSQLCNDASQLPYVCDSQSCNFLPKDKLTKLYSQWQTHLCYNSTENNVLCTSIGECQTDENCSDNNKCINNKCTCSINEDCNGTSTCQNDGFCSPNGAGCFVGNFLLRQWCENPISRCGKLSDGTYPKECNGSSTQPGVTDVPPFYYNQNLGSCFMTPEYCNRFGLDFNLSKTCTNDNDCNDLGNNYVCNTSHNPSYCVGPNTDCVENTGQQLAEMFLGKTLFRMWKSGVQCDSFSFTKNIIEKLNSLPSTIEVNIDPKFVKNKIIVKENFIPDINLYIIESTDPNIPKFLSVDYQQIKNKYPFLLNKKNNINYLIITREHAKNDKYLKRLFCAMGTKDDLSKFIAGIIKINKNTKNKI